MNYQEASGKEVAITITRPIVGREYWPENAAPEPSVDQHSEPFLDHTIVISDDFTQDEGVDTIYLILFELGHILLHVGDNPQKYWGRKRSQRHKDGGMTIFYTKGEIREAAAFATLYRKKLEGLCGSSSIT